MGSFGFKGSCDWIKGDLGKNLGRLEMDKSNSDKSRGSYPFNDSPWL